MTGRSRPQFRGSTQSTASAIVSLVMLIAAGVSNAYAQTKSATAAWIQVGTGTGPAKVSVRAASASGATVTIEIPGIQAESVAINGAQYLKLAIPGAVSAVLDVGKPEVPAVPVLLARPTGSAVTLRVLSIETETLDIARVYPMQRMQKYGERAGPLAVDNSFYASDVEYPSDRLSSPRTATWRDLDVVNVHVYPVTVRPAQRQVIVTSRITFRADFSGGSYPRRVSSWMVPMYRRLVQNYDDLRLTPLAQEPAGTRCLVFCDSGYYNDDYKNPALDSLLELMTMLGDSTEVINVPVDVPAEPESIKSVIIDRYDPFHTSHALRWVFLVGRHDQIPPRDSSSGYTLYSDYWYSDLEGPNNFDWCDGYPEVGIARLSPASDTDLSNQIAKIRDYMLGSDAGAWLDTMTFVSAIDESAAYTVRAAVRENDSARFFRYGIDTIMGKPDTTGPTNEDVRARVKSGTGVLIYLGHGEYDRWLAWSGGLHWTKAEVYSLENQQTPVVFNLACECGRVVHDSCCLSETWMSKYDSNGKGAVASFGSYVDIWQAPANDQCMVAVMALGDYDTLRDTLRPPPHEYTAPVFDLGGIQMLMDADIATKWPDSTGWRNIYSFYWLGNPAMPVWSGGVPETATVSYPSWITPGDTSFLVTVEMGGQGVEGAQVCVYKPDDFYAVGLTNSSGTVTLSLTVNDTGSFFVSASKGHKNLSTPDAEHTPMLPYFGTAYVGVNAEMTYPNWSRKLVRTPGTNTLHVVYTADGSVFYKQSTNAGDSWTTPEFVGAGSCPAIAIHDGWSGLVPWVVYLTPDGSIMRAIRSEGFPPLWDMATVFQSDSIGRRAGAPSLAAGHNGVNPVGNVTYPVYVDSSSTISYIYYKSFTLLDTSGTEVVDGPQAESCYGASVDVTPLNLIHVAWIRGQSVIYRERDSVSVWSPQVPISDTVWPPTEPASRPSVEAYGEFVYCVWRGPDSLGNYQKGDIWRRARWLNDPVDDWRPVANQSQSPDRESDFPVMITDFVTVWHEEVSKDNVDIFGKFAFLGPLPFFESSLPSRYPHVDGYWVPGTMKYVCKAVWTEMLQQDPPEYEVRFDTFKYIPALGKGLGPGPHEDYEPALYYAARLGKPEQSPYCLSRGGFAQFESWNADTSATGLAYRLPYLDPQRMYQLCAVIYHEGKKSWSANVRCDSGAWTLVKSEPGVPETLWLKVPRHLYKRDARIVLELSRVTGDYVSLAKLKLFQIEEEAGGDGGVQSWGTGMTFVTRLRGCTPNPFAKGTSVNYELAQYGPVELTVHDVSGRLVRRLESGPRCRGFHAAGWDGTDGRGRVLPAGVYFVRYSAGGTASTGRLTLVR